MKKLILVAFAITSLTSCYTTTQVPNSSYSYKMLNEKKEVIDTGSTVGYTDSLVNATFSIGKESVSFVLRNKTENTMKILWDECLFIKNGVSEKVMHEGIKYTDKNQSMPPSVIPAGLLHTDIIIPTNNVYWSQGYYSQYGSIPSEWKTKPLFPESTGEGTTFSIFMPMVVNNQQKEYTFNFEVGKKTTTYREERVSNFAGTFALTMAICLLPLLFLL